MTTALWIVQGLLGLVFLMTGGMKLMQPKEKLLERMGILENIPPNLIKTIGALEVAGAIGLILPIWLGIAPFLTPLAALGLILTMIGAAYAHFRRGEMPNIGANVVLGLLAAFILWGRFGLLGL